MDLNEKVFVTAREILGMITNNEGATDHKAVLGLPVDYYSLIELPNGKEGVVGLPGVILELESISDNTDLFKTRLAFNTPVPGYYTIGPEFFAVYASGKDAAGNETRIFVDDSKGNSSKIFKILREALGDKAVMGDFP